MHRCSISLDLGQLNQLLEMLEGGEPEERVVITHAKEGVCGEGLYAYWEECHEEGSIYLNEYDQTQGGQ